MHTPTDTKHNNWIKRDTIEQMLMFRTVRRCHTRQDTKPVQFQAFKVFGDKFYFKLPIYTKQINVKLYKISKGSGDGV
jgi:hypothetical protein